MFAYQQYAGASQIQRGVDSALIRAIPQTACDHCLKSTREREERQELRLLVNGDES